MIRGALAALALVFTAPVTVTGCATLEVIAPQSVNEALVQAEIAIIATADATRASLERGVITREQAAFVSERLSVAAQALDAAYFAVSIGDMTAARLHVRDALKIVEQVSKVTHE